MCLLERGRAPQKLENMRICGTDPFTMKRYESTTCFADLIRSFTLRQKAKLSIIACVLFTLCGCKRSATVVTNVTYFPGSATWDTATNWLVVEAKGEPGKAFSEFGAKHVRIVLLRMRNEITNYSYTVDASLLGWTVTWSNLEDIRIDFYNESTNHPIKAILFTFNPNTPDFRPK